MADTNPLETLRAEQVEAVELLRTVFPDISDTVAENVAFAVRGWIYRKGRRPTADEVRTNWERRVRELTKAHPTETASSDTLMAAE